jgi:citrate synthase
MARMPGWLGHCLEQLADNKLIRPKADYVGPHGVTYVPMGQR